MITAVFKIARGVFYEVSVSGHAGYAESGRDIVCASVTSAVQLVSNGITEALKIPLGVDIGEESISLTLPPGSPEISYCFMEALWLHLDILSRQYGDFIEITIMEE